VARETELAWLPGVSTATEVMQARKEGFSFLKFFPAESAGGMPMLKNFASVFSDICFCPTGGITLELAQKYLQLPNVVCVGGSWVVPKDLIERGDWAGITALAKNCSSLRN